MKLRTLVLRELFERKHQMITSLLMIILSMTVITGINTISHFSKLAVAKELDKLGFNILIIPKESTTSGYYSADIQSSLLPEKYITRLAHSGLHGMDLLSPKLTVPIKLQGHNFILTGILPNNEIKALASRQKPNPFFGKRPQKSKFKKKPQLKGQQMIGGRLIHNLGKNEIIIGSDSAKILSLKIDSTLKIKNQIFTVKAILPESGTVDDGRIFAHLHSVQLITGKPGVISAIEIIGCCDKIKTGLVPELDRLVPQAKIVTIKQLVGTQQKTNHLMSRFALIFFIVIGLSGGAMIANYMSANVFERRHEIGILIALGAYPSLVLKLFISKGILLGAVGGLGGFIAGTILAMLLGPEIAGLEVSPLFNQLGLSLLISIFISLVASFFPARRAASLDPCTTFREV